MEYNLDIKLSIKYILLAIYNWQYYTAMINKPGYLIN